MANRQNIVHRNDFFIIVMLKPPPPNILIFQMHFSSFHCRFLKLFRIKFDSQGLRDGENSSFFI